MWPMISHSDVGKRLKRYQKKWPREMVNVLDNLDSLHRALCAGSKPEQLKSFGFVHSEPMGILAVDQKGTGKGKLKQFRLYTFADLVSETLHLRILGDKDTQSDDIALAKVFVQGILDARERKVDEQDAEAG